MLKLAMLLLCNAVCVYVCVSVLVSLTFYRIKLIHVCFSEGERSGEQLRVTWGLRT